MTESGIWVRPEEVRQMYDKLAPFDRNNFEKEIILECDREKVKDLLDLYDEYETTMDLFELVGNFDTDEILDELSKKKIINYLVETYDVNDLLDSIDIDDIIRYYESKK